MFNINQSNNNVLDAIEEIYNISKDSLLTFDLSKETKLSTWLDTLKSFFECDEEQAILLAIMIQSNLENNNVSIKEIIDHANLKTSASIYINNVLAPLVKLEWISPKKDVKYYPLTEYNISNKLIRSVLTGKLEMNNEVKIENSFQLLAHFQMRLGEKNHKRISYAEFIKWTNELLNTHASIELSDFILKMNMPEDDATHFMYACSRFYTGQEESDYDDIIRDLTPPKDVQYKLRNSFKSGSNFLIKSELIKETVSDDMFKSTSYSLTEKAVRAFDKTAVVKNKLSEGMMKHLEPNAITEKKLIFDSNEQKLVNKLHNMLSVDNFSQLTERLESQGMKKGISVLLYGYPGTGKTETVLQLGKNSNRYIMMADASKIRSKWVGETEKNMKALFDEYRKAMVDFKETPILLFNEADAILGKRHTVTDRGDQMENAMQNILLQELENFEGIFIATTNLVDNLDKAFDRRFLYKIRFEKPGAQTLIQIWKSKFPKIKTGILKNICAKINLTGGQIENIRKKIAVDSLLDDKLKINENYLMQLAQQELMLDKKNERNAIGFNQGV